jgi:hypothetical protein
MIEFIDTSITIKTNYNSSQSMAAYDSLHSLLNYECLLCHCDDRQTKNPLQTNYDSRTNEFCRAFSRVLPL